MDEIRIERLGHLGDGIAEGPVYAPRVLPGEVVRGEIRAGRIDDPRIVMPSPDRVAPPCPHYRRCGGCALMHASDRFVAGWKSEVVRRALAAQGIDAEIAAVETSPAASRRRAVLSGRRLKGGPVAGFHARASDTVTQKPACRILRPELLAALPAVEATVAALGTRKGELRLALTASETGVDLAVEGVREPDGTLRLALSGLAEIHDLARLTIANETVVERRAPVQKFDGIAVVLPPDAFLQATAEGEAALRRAVTAAIEGARRVADLFAGAGTFSLPLARGAEVHAVEASGAMLAALDRGWRHATGLRRVTTEVRDLFRTPLTSSELDAYDAVIIDPPRAGAEAQMRALATSRVPRVASVSCNPVSFARDARVLLDGGYEMGPVTVVDQFRWSVHVELAAAFRRDHMPRRKR